MGNDVEVNDENINFEEIFNNVEVAKLNSENGENNVKIISNKKKKMSVHVYIWIAVGGVLAICVLSLLVYRNRRGTVQGGGSSETTLLPDTQSESAAHV